MKSSPANDDYLPRPSSPLPSRQDFDPHYGDLDAQSAWDTFGELSIQQAYKLFLSKPEIHQEDFMFMGSRAFEYYFPVVDRYLRTVEADADNFEHGHASILGSAITAQLGRDGARFSNRLLEEIENLALFVFSNTHRYSEDTRDVRRITKEWDKVTATMQTYRLSHPS